jgi:F-type H+-transporting ATPase subunit delta
MAVAQRIYAKALFDAAKEKGRVREVTEELAGFVEAVEASPELRNLLLNPQIDARAKRAGLDAVFEGAEPVFLNFLRLAADKGRLGEIDEVQHEFERLVAEDERVLKVDLVTAQDLSDAEAADIIETIERASGRRVDATRSVDPSLIGGIVLQAGSFRADASVRGRLDSLRHELAART